MWFGADILNSAPPSTTIVPPFCSYGAFEFVPPVDVVRVVVPPEIFSVPAFMVSVVSELLPERTSVPSPLLIVRELSERPECVSVTPDSTLYVSAQSGSASVITQPHKANATATLFLHVNLFMVVSFLDFRISV
jgi:hypothetical protein